MMLKMPGRRRRKKALVDLACVQHRIMEILPAMAVTIAEDECLRVFGEMLENLEAVADAIDPWTGRKFIEMALYKSRDEIYTRWKAGGKENEQGDTDRKPGE